MNNKRYAQIDNISAVYDTKTNSVSLIGNRGKFENGFKIRLKQGSIEDTQIRKTLFESEARKLDYTKDNFYPENLPPRLNQIPLGVNQHNEEVSWNFMEDSSHLLITGKVASGKTFLLNHIKGLLEQYYGNSSDIYYFDEGLSRLNGSIEKVQLALNNIAEALKLKSNRSTPTFLLIDETNYIYNDDTKDAIDWLLQTGRSYNLHIIFAAHNTTNLQSIRQHCQEVSMDTLATQTSLSYDLDSLSYDVSNSVRRYGMLLSIENTELFVPYLPKSFDKR